MQHRTGVYALFWSLFWSSQVCHHNSWVSECGVRGEGVCSIEQVRLGSEVRSGSYRVKDTGEVSDSTTIQEVCLAALRPT